MNIQTLRERSRIDLCDRSEHHELPVWPRRCDGIEQLSVKTFVDDAEKTEPWMGDTFLIFRVFATRACLHEVVSIDAARKRMNCWMLFPLGFVQALTAGKDHVGAFQQFTLMKFQGFRRAPE